MSNLKIPPENDAYLLTEPLEFIGDLYDIMKDGDCLTSEHLIEDIKYMLSRYLAAHPQKEK